MKKSVSLLKIYAFAVFFILAFMSCSSNNILEEEKTTNEISSSYNEL